MEIQINSRKAIPGLKKQTIRRNLTKVLSDLGCHDKELSVLFTDDDDIAQLNRNYRGKEGPTNVLAFPMTGSSGADIETCLLGDVVISVDTAQKESIELAEPTTVTINRLLIHGLLHLLGFDHTGSPEDAQRMEKEEKRLLDLMKEV